MLELLRVTRRFGEKTVLFDVSLRVRPGRVLLVAGANGSGKSTLLRLMAGLLRPDEGTIARRVSPGKIALLGHGTMVYPELSALENLAFWASLHGLALTKDALRARLRAMDLEKEADETAGTFSRGMAQRLALARALLPEPDLLLLDEPGTGLDAASQNILRREIRAARTRGAALVWVSHGVARDLPLADEAVLLARKTVSFYGPAASFPVDSFSVDSFPPTSFSADSFTSGEKT